MKTASDDSVDVIAINFSRPLGLFGSEVARVARDGESVVSIGYNYDGKREIGVWRHTISPAVFAELVRRLHASNYLNVGSPEEVAPGTALMTFGEQRSGDRYPKLRSFWPSQAELAPVTEYLSVVMAELRQHPVHVLRGEARWQEVGLVKGKKEEIQLTLSNVGTSPLQIANPLHEASERFQGVRVEFTNLESELLGAADVPIADVKAATVTPEPPILTLNPGESLSLSIRVKVPVSPGKYRTQVTFSSQSGTTVDRALVNGTLSLDPGNVSVARSWFGIKR